MAQAFSHQPLSIRVWVQSMWGLWWTQYQTFSLYRKMLVMM